MLAQKSSSHKGGHKGKKRFPHSISIARCYTADQQLHDAPDEPQCKLSVLWNGGTDCARAVHADAAINEAADANGRQEGRGNRKGGGKVLKMEGFRVAVHACVRA